MKRRVLTFSGLGNSMNQRQSKLTFKCTKRIEVLHLEGRKGARISYLGGRVIEKRISDREGLPVCTAENGKP